MVYRRCFASNMGDAAGNLNQVEEVAAQDVFVDLQAEFQWKFGEEGAV